MVTDGLNKSSEATPGKHSIDSLQKTAVLGTAHIIRKVLQCETGRWGSPLVQGRYWGEKARDKGQRNNNNNNNDNNNKSRYTVQEMWLTLEGGRDRLSRNSVITTNVRCVTSQKSEGLI